MKILIASDIHGDALAMKNILAAFASEGADKLLLLGDLLYHGPRNDLPKDYAPKEVIQLLNENKENIMAVRGNCEAEVDQMVLDFPVLADYCYLYVDGLSIFVTHGHKFNCENPPKLQEGDILLHGHTHVPAAQDFGNKNCYLNPGSVSLPKENNPKTYMIYENRSFTLKDFDGNVIFTRSF